MTLLYEGRSKIEMKDLLRKLEDWEVNPRCLKSIKYKHKKKYLVESKRTEHNLIREIQDKLNQ